MLTTIRSQDEIGYFPDVMVLCDDLGTPRIAAMLWQSLVGSRYAKSYLRRNLRAIEALYLHHESSVQKDNLDDLFLSGRINQIYVVLRSFLAKLQNDSAISEKDQSERWQMVIRFCTETLDEIQHRSPDLKYKIGFDKAKADLRRIEALYSFLKPEKNLSVRKVRSIPSPVLSDIFEVISPIGARNPFRGEKLKWRNFLIVSLLLYQGLRAGELLGLPANCVKHSFDPTVGKDIFWLNVKSSDLWDSRSTQPKIKNTDSVRQIPIDPSLASQIQSYNLNYRGKLPHGFLISSNQSKPLSKSGLACILDKVSMALSDKSETTLESEIGKSKVTPHNFRHTCAVMRIQDFLSRDIELGKAEELMRSFFGWSKTSKMPAYYTQAFYPVKLQELIDTDFSERFKILGLLE